MNPAASPRRSGRNAPVATRGDGIQIAAPPRPITASAMASAPPLCATDASSNPAVEKHSPMRINGTSAKRVDSAATTTVPTRYAVTLTVPSKPATRFEPRRSSRTAGSTTPYVNLPNDCATHTPAITSAMTTTADERVRSKGSGSHRRPPERQLADCVGSCSQRQREARRVRARYL